MGSNVSPRGQLALSTRENHNGTGLTLDISKRSMLKTNTTKYEIGNINILNLTPTPSPPPPKPFTTPPINPTKSPQPSPSTKANLAAARLLLSLSTHIAAAETLLTLYTFGPPTKIDSATVFNSTKNNEDSKMVNIYCHGTNLHLQKPQEQAQAYLRSLSPAGRKGLVLLPADVRRDGRLFPEELHGKIDCRRCAAVRAVGLGYGGCGSETEEVEEEVPVMAELALESCNIKQSRNAKKRESAVRVAKAPRKRVRIAEAKMEDVGGAVALGFATVVGGKMTRSRRAVKVPMRFGG